MSVKIVNPAVFSLMSAVVLENKVVISLLPVGAKCTAKKQGINPLDFFTLWGEELLVDGDDLTGYSQVHGIPQAYYRVSEEETFLTKLQTADDLESLARFIDRSRYARSKKERDLLIVCDSSWRTTPGSLAAQIQEVWLKHVCGVSGSHARVVHSKCAELFSTATKKYEESHARKS